MNNRIRQIEKCFFRLQKNPPIMCSFESPEDEGTCFRSIVFVEVSEYAALKAEYGDKLKPLFEDDAPCS